jgi:hypothetical protein
MKVLVYMISPDLYEEKKNMASDCVDAMTA